MMKADLLSVSNKIAQLNNIKKGKSILSEQNNSNDSNFNQLLSQLINQETATSKPNDNNASKQLPTDKSTAALKHISFDLLNNILQYLKSKASDSKPDSPQTQYTNDLLKELSQLISQKTATSKPNDNNTSKQLPTDKSTAALPTKNENNKNVSANPYENTVMSANIINYTKSKSLDSNNLAQTDQNFSNNLTLNTIVNNQTKKNNILDTQSKYSPNKPNNAFNNNLNTLIEHAGSSNIAKNNTVSVLNQSNQTIDSSGMQKSILNQDFTPINVKYSLQAQNNNAVSTNTQTLKNSIVLSALYDSKTNKTSNANQTFQSKGISISIDPKSLQIASKDTNQPASILYRAMQKGQETQLNTIDKIKGDLINNENKNLQQESLNFQTISQIPQSQAKSINSPSSNMQAIIDKILEIKNLTPPVIKTVTIQVNPPSLGSIDLKVSIDSNKNLTATINVQNQDLFDAINKNLDSLKNVLQNQGFNITQISLLNTKNDAQQNFYQNNQNQQNFNNFLNFNQGSNHKHNNQQGNFSQTFNQKQEDNRQSNYNMDNKLIAGGKTWSNPFIIDINI